ncbi:hypothetical protein GCM10009557_87290 [Virgisporangium ochraceum]
MLMLMAMALMVTPMVVLFVCERAAKRGRGPLAQPDRMPVLDGRIVSTSIPEQPLVPAGPVFTGPGDTEGCAAESRLVRGLLAGTIDRTRYHREMAALAAVTAAPAVQLPGEPG